MLPVDLDLGSIHSKSRFLLCQKMPLDQSCVYNWACYLGLFFKNFCLDFYSSYFGCASWCNTLIFVLDMICGCLSYFVCLFFPSGNVFVLLLFHFFIY